MAACPFCAIVEKKLPAQSVYEDEYAVAFHDIRPLAPVHVLVVPKEHVENMDAVADLAMWSRLMVAVKAVVGKLGLTGDYRIVINCGKSAGQTVSHLHIHLLSGRGQPVGPGF